MIHAKLGQPRLRLGTSRAPGTARASTVLEPPHVGGGGHTPVVIAVDTNGSGGAMGQCRTLRACVRRSRQLDGEQQCRQQAGEVSDGHEFQ